MFAFVATRLLQAIPVLLVVGLISFALFDYVGDREQLTHWAEAKGEAGLEEYRRQKNAVSIDGLPTGMFEESPV